MSAYYPLSDCEEVPLALAKNWLAHKVYDGATCPCCGQLARVTRFKINGGMAMLLTRMKRWEELPIYPNRWINVRAAFEKINININTYNFYKLKHWGVVECRSLETDEAARGTGMWRLTKFGQEFAQGKGTVAKHVYYYNDRLIKRSEDDRVSLGEVLGDRFSFSGLMAPYDHAGMPVPEELTS